jgi:hypothetical protein
MSNSPAIPHVVLEVEKRLFGPSFVYSHDITVVGMASGWFRESFWK